MVKGIKDKVRKELAKCYCPFLWWHWWYTKTTLPRLRVNLPPFHFSKQNDVSLLKGEWMLSRQKPQIPTLWANPMSSTINMKSLLLLKCRKQPLCPPATKRLTIWWHLPIDLLNSLRPEKTRTEIRRNQLKNKKERKELKWVNSSNQVPDLKAGALRWADSGVLTVFLKGGNSFLKDCPKHVCLMVYLPIYLPHGSIYRPWSWGSWRLWRLDRLTSPVIPVLCN